MELRICDLATVFLRNIVGSAAFILGSLNFVASAETPAERGSYLVNSIGACGNCQARDSAANRTPDLTGGLRGQRSARASLAISRPIPTRASASGATKTPITLSPRAFDRTARNWPGQWLLVCTQDDARRSRRDCSLYADDQASEKSIREDGLCARET
jgi:hypothetical protein